MGVSFYNKLDVLLLVVFAYLLYQIVRKFGARTGKTLPGPPGIPVVGNAYQIPRDRQWLKFDEWIKRYGTAGPTITL